MRFPCVLDKIQCFSCTFNCGAVPRQNHSRHDKTIWTISGRLYQYICLAHFEDVTTVHIYFLEANQLKDHIWDNRINAEGQPHASAYLLSPIKSVEVFPPNSIFSCLVFPGFRFPLFFQVFTLKNQTFITGKQINWMLSPEQCLKRRDFDGDFYYYAGHRL